MLSFTSIDFDDDLDNLNNGGMVITPVSVKNVNDFDNYSFSSIYFDYLTFTFPCDLFPSLKGDCQSEERFKTMLEMLKLNLSECNHSRGQYNYSDKLEWKHSDDESNKEVTTKFLFGALEDSDGSYLTKNANGEITSCVELSGGACRALERRFGNNLNEAWKSLYDCLNSIHAKVSRFDLAFDLFNINLNLPEYLFQKYMNGLLSSSFKKFSYEHGLSDRNLNDTAQTFYIGSRKSDFFIRVYDKKAENSIKGVEDMSQNHYRIEFSTRHERAQKLYEASLVNYFNGTLHEMTTGLILNYICPKILNKNMKLEKISMLEDDPIFTNLFKEVEKKKIQAFQRGKLDIERKCDWLMQSISALMATVYLARGRNFEHFFRDLLITGLKKLDFKDKKLIGDINAFRISRDMNLLNVCELNQIEELLNNNDKGENVCKI